MLSPLTDFTMLLAMRRFVSCPFGSSPLALMIPVRPTPVIRLLRIRVPSKPSFLVPLVSTEMPP